MSASRNRTALLLLGLGLTMAACAPGGAAVPPAADRGDGYGGSKPPAETSLTPPRASSKPNADSPLSVWPYPEELPRTYATAAWPLFKTFDGVLAEADVFVVAEVVAVRSGRTFGDVQPLPSTDVDLLVTNVGKGELRAKDIVTLTQTGGLYRPTHIVNDAKGSVAPLPSDAPPGVEPYAPPSLTDTPVLLQLDDDPLLRVGERVALALRWVPDLKVYVLLNPQGRFNVDLAGGVHVVRKDDPAVAGLENLTIEQLIARVGAAATP